MDAPCEQLQYPQDTLGSTPHHLPQEYAQAAQAVAEKQIKADAAFLNNASGYVWEGLITSLSGAQAGGKGTVWDYSRGQIKKNKKGLESVFGSLGNLLKADGKSKEDSKLLARSPGGKYGSLPDKTISSINKGSVTGVSIGNTSNPDLVAHNKAHLARGGGIGGTDNVPALLTPGEFVIRRKAVKAVGLPLLQRINNAGKGRGGKPSRIWCSDFEWPS